MTGNPFNSKHKDTELLNDDSEDRSDPDDIDDVEDDTKSENPDIFANQNKKPEFKYFTEESSQSPPVSQQQQQQSWEDESDGEWTENGGIPGEPGKDYPLLGDVGYGTDRTEFLLQRKTDRILCRCRTEMSGKIKILSSVICIDKRFYV